MVMPDAKREFGRDMSVDESSVSRDSMSNRRTKIVPHNLTELKNDVDRPRAPP